MSLEKIQNTTKAFIIGSDECGYGSWAGPVVVCGVKAPKDWNLEGLNDSKKLSEKKRMLMDSKLRELAAQVKYNLL
jgi:ribonuclease HII